jgi:hypothetical protein
MASHSIATRLALGKRRLWHLRLLPVVALVAMAPIAAAANETQEIRELRKEVGELRDAVRELKSQLQQLKGQPPVPAATTDKERDLEAEIRAATPQQSGSHAATPAESVAQPAIGPGVGKSSSILNPDISFNGDFTFLGTDNRQLNKANRFSFREAEVGFQAPIDPYARADAFITFGEGESPEVEEAYATFLTLPYNLQARIGKFRLSFGKNNLLHRHALSQTDRPLAEVANFGDEGVSGTGVGISYLVPNPWDQYVLVTGEVANGLGEELEGAQGIPLDSPAPGRSLDDFVYVGHAQTFFDLNANNNVEVGGSFLANEPRSGTDTRVYGVDLTYRWRPLAQQGYRQFLWRSEGYFTHEDTHAAGPSVFDTSGAYTYGEYRLAQTQWVGIRVDWTEIPGTSGKKEWGVYPYFTFSPLEFGYFRVGYEYVRSDQLNDKDSNRVWLQYNFSIGPHAAHAF